MISASFTFVLLLGSCAPSRQEQDNTTPLHSLAFMIGTWVGEQNEDGSTEEGAAVARVSSMIEGFGLLQFVDFTWGEKTFSALGYDTSEKVWIGLSADNRQAAIRRLVGQVAAQTVTFTSKSSLGEIVERWSCEDQDRCRWERSFRRKGATVARLTADLRRDE